MSEKRGIFDYEKMVGGVYKKEKARMETLAREGFYKTGKRTISVKSKSFDRLFLDVKSLYDLSELETKELSDRFVPILKQVLQEKEKVYRLLTRDAEDNQLNQSKYRFILEFTQDDYKIFKGKMQRKKKNKIKLSKSYTRLNVNLPDEMFLELKSMCDADNITMTEFVKRSFKKYKIDRDL